MKQENITLLKAWATATDNLEIFVYLREDENGRYIEYAFIEGAPHDNRCLSWYDKLQPNALRRNGHDISKWPLHKVDETGQKPGNEMDKPRAYQSRGAWILLYYIALFECPAVPTGS